MYTLVCVFLCPFVFYGKGFTTLWALFLEYSLLSYSYLYSCIVSALTTSSFILFVCQSYAVKVLYIFFFMSDFLLGTTIYPLVAIYMYIS